MNSQFPYVGLRPYEITDKSIFFGRDEQILEIVNLFLNNNNEKNFVAIIGEQGVGKSSLIKAGFLPPLAQGMRPGEVTWRVALFTPKNDPLDQLTKALYDRTLTEEEQNCLSDKYKNEYNEQIYDTIRYDVIEKLAHIGAFFEDAGVDKNTDFFIVIDQFEELLRTYQRAMQDGNIDRLDECDNFVDILLRSAEQPNIYIIITMRAEFIGECINFHGLIEAVNKGLFLVPKMTREQLKEAIIRPLKLFDKLFDDDIEDYLVQRILADSVEESNSLPVIQHVLLRMWLYAKNKRGGKVELTYEDYKEVGGFHDAIDKHAEEIYNALTKEQKRLCRGIFQCITERTISKNYVVNGRHPMRLESIAEILHAAEKELIEVIEFFNDYTCGFITPIRSEQGISLNTIIDISHESLMSHWKSLQGWVEEEYENAQMYKLLRDDARSWKFQSKNTVWKGGKLVDAVKWLEDYKPSDEWAKKYEVLEGYDDTINSNLPLVKEFVRYGQKKEKIANGVWTAVVSLVLMAFVAIYYQDSLHRQQQEHANQTKIISYLDNARLLTKTDNYAQAEQELAKLQQIDKKYITATQQYTSNLFSWYNGQLMSAKSTGSTELPKPMYNLYFDESSQLLIVGGEEAQLLFYDKNIQLQNYPFVNSIVGKNKSINVITSYQDTIFIAVYEHESKQTTIYQLDTPITAENSQLLPIHVVAGSTLAVAAYKNKLAYADENHNIILFDLETKQQIKQLQGHQGTIFDLKFNHQATLLASASGDKTARLWDLSKYELKELIIHQEAIPKIAFNHQGNLLASASYDKTVKLLDVENPQNSITSRSHKAAVLGIAFSQDDKFLISASKDRTIHILDVESGKTLRVLEGHQDQVNALVVVDQQIYSIGGDNQLKQWDLTLGMQWVTLTQPKSVSISNQYIAVGFENGNLAIYTPNFDQQLWEIPAHEAAIKRIQFNPQGNLLATLDKKDTLKLWQTETATQLHRIEQAAKAMTFSDDNQYLAYAGNDGKIGLFSLSDKTTQTYQTPTNSLRSIAFHPNNGELASASKTGVYIWRIKNGQFEFHTQLNDAPEQVDHLNYSSDGKQLAVVGANPNTPYFYATAHYDRQIPIGGHTETIAKAIFTPHHQYIATLGTDNTIRFWNLNHELFTIPLPLRDTFDVGYDTDFDFKCNPDGKCLMVIPLKNRNAVLVYELMRF